MRRGGAGDGDLCPVNPEHGRMFVLPSRRQYCSEQSHDGGRGIPRTPNLYEYDGVTPARRTK